MSIKALSFRLAAASVILAIDHVRARLDPVHSNDPADPNLSFSKHAPTAAFEFTITNPDAFDFLKPGVVYDLVMVPRDGDYAVTAYSTVPLADAPAQAVPVEPAAETEAGAAPAPAAVDPAAAPADPAPAA